MLRNPIPIIQIEKQIGYDLDSQMDPAGKNITVVELVERYLRTKTGVRDSTRAGYRIAQRISIRSQSSWQTGTLPAITSSPMRLRTAVSLPSAQRT